MNYIETVKEIYKFMKYLKPFYKFQIYIMMVLFISTILGLLGPLIQKLTIDEFFIGKNIEVLYIVVVLQTLLFIFNKVFSVSKSYLSMYMGNFISMTMRSKAFESILNAEAKELINTDIGEIFVTFDNDILAIESAITGTIINLLLTIFNFITSTAIMFLLSWKYGIAIFLVVPFYLINNNAWLKLIMEKSKANRESVSKMFTYVNEVFHNIRFFKLLAKEKYAERGFLNKNRDMMMKIFDSFKISLISSSISEFIGFGDMIFLLIVGGMLVFKGEITLGTYLALTAYAGNAKGSFMTLVSFNVNMASVMISIERLEKLLNMPREKLSGDKIKEKIEFLEFKNVDFFYEEGQDVLKNFNLKIKKGEKLAFVGESGSGKSTIINLIMGIYKVKDGEVLVGDINLKNIDKRMYRKRIGIVSQESFFFSETIRNNLLLGEKKKDEEIIRICKICQIDDFINSTSNGLDTMLEGGGANLSGGQKQRLSIARMLLRNPEIIILDEATSALDNITEAKIQASLEEELKNKTVISIAHRLSTIESSDRIIVLKDGKIVEEGSHKALLKNKDYYFNLQMLREENEE